MSKKKRNGESRKAMTASKNTNQSVVKNNESANNNAAESQQAQQATESPEEKVVRKAYELSPEWKISVIAKRKFMALPSSLQNGAGKEACVKEALNGHKEIIPDPIRYWIWLIDETKKLCRVWDFEETCKKFGRDPLTVAQHLILEGKMVCNGVRMEGLESYGSKVAMFIEPLFKDEFHLFGSMISETVNADE